MTEKSKDPEGSAELHESARALFEPHRAYLAGVAYRMLGVHTDVDDVLQETFIRLCRVDLSEVERPRAYLAQMVTRLCLDHLRSARVRREHYVGPWLPEPIVHEGPADPPATPDEVTAMREDVSLALMFALERLSPLERAAFLLHDVFDVDYVEIATVLGRDEVACRQLATRGRKHVRASRPRFESEPAEGRALLGAFAAAALTGDVTALSTFLAEDVIFASDGGGKAKAATKVVEGPDRVAKLVVGIVTRHYAGTGAEISPAVVNGQPGFLVRQDGRVTQAMAVDIGDGRIVGIYSVRNPDKLRHLNRLNRAH